MIVAAAGTGGTKAMWYLTRGSGIVALLLLTATVVLGVVEWRRWTPGGWPRFIVDAVHRNLSLLSLVFLAIHIVSSILDTFAPIALVDVVIPFTGTYRPLWLGLGALSLDLMVAVAVTSMLRERIGYRAWRVTHWLAYASWPLALVHGFGTGSDTKTGWVLILSAACLLAVMAAVWARAINGWPSHAGLRAGAIAATVIAPLSLAIWLPSGPLAKGWAKRAGTPVALLGPTIVPARSTTAVAKRGPTVTSSPIPSSLSGAFNANLTGTLVQGNAPTQGELALSMALRLPGDRRLGVILDGQPLQGGGISMSASSVALGTAARPAIYTGTVTSLSGSDLRASVSHKGSHQLLLDINLSIDPNSNQVTGTLTAQPGSGG
jgi:sulfoxide reductase heme-binding subunit YedZ